MKTKKTIYCNHFRLCLQCNKRFKSKKNWKRKIKYCSRYCKKKAKENIRYYKKIALTPTTAIQAKREIMEHYVNKLKNI
jgi:hypothetical protein